MHPFRDTTLIDTLVRLQPRNAVLSLQEVVQIGGEPSLGRTWCSADTTGPAIGTPVVDTVYEPDDRVIAAFNEFIRSDRHDGDWFTFLCSDDRVIAIARCASDDVDPETLRSLRRQLVAEVNQQVVAISPVTRSFFAVLRPDGKPRSSSPEAPFNWAAPTVVEALQDCVQQVPRQGRFSTLVPGYFVELHHMSGDNGAGDVLAAFKPVQFAPMPALATLSPTQGRVVRYAAAGATAPEIARAMDRSAGTVRSHLREAYRRLDVASRMELMASSEELSGWGAR